MEIYISKSQLASQDHYDEAVSIFKAAHLGTDIKVEHYDFSKHGKYSTSIIDNKDAVIVIPPEGNNVFIDNENENKVAVYVGYGNFNEVSASIGQGIKTYFYNKDQQTIVAIHNLKELPKGDPKKNPKYMHGVLQGFNRFAK